MSFAWGIFTMVTITVIWASSFVVVKDTLDVLPASLLAFLRVGLAMLSLLWIKPERKALIPGLLLGLIVSCELIALLIGLTSTTASKAAFIFACSALVAPFLSSWLFKNRVPRRAYLGIVIALAGLGIMTLIGQGGVNPGDVWIFIGALFYGLSIAYTGEVANKVSTLALVQVQFGVMTLVMTVWAVPHLATIPTLNLNTWLVLLYLGVVCTSLPFALQVWAQRVVPPYLTALLFILEPVFASIFAFVILGERLGGLDLLGAALIVAALFVCILPLRADSQKAVTVSRVE